MFGAAPSVPSPPRECTAVSALTCWCVVLGSAVSADWLLSCAPAACVSVAVEHSVTCTCTKVE